MRDLVVLRGEEVDEKTADFFMPVNKPFGVTSVIDNECRKNTQFF